MHHPHLPGEAPQEAADGLGRQGDLGHQHDGLFALAQHLRHRLQVNFGLAGAGHAVQQEGPRRLASPGGRQPLQHSCQDALLVRGQPGRRRQDGGNIGHRVAPGLRLSQDDQLELGQLFQVGRRFHRSGRRPRAAPQARAPGPGSAGSTGGARPRRSGRAQPARARMSANFDFARDAGQLRGAHQPGMHGWRRQHALRAHQPAARQGLHGPAPILVREGGFDLPAAQVAAPLQQR